MSDLNSQLRAFLNVGELGSAAHAPKRMFVTQAAVTTRIKALERWLRYPCFVRSHHGPR
jgi:DNA-binding transcriptional LysR family regulator